MIDPLVIVHPRKVKGAETMQGARKRLTFFKPMRLSEAMEKKWPFFAHFTLYTLQGESAWPRLNKPVLPELIEAGLIPQIHVTSLDYDTPGHSASLSPADFQNMLAEWPTDLPSPTYAYRTRHGARFVIVHPALLPHEAEAFHRACVNAAPYLDPRVWEWNRGHVLPYVCREPGVPAIDDPMLVKAKPARQLPTLKDPGEARFVHAYADAPMPDPIDAEALVRYPTTHKLTSWGKRAKKRLATRDSEDALTWPPPPTPKRRNPTLLRWIGSLCSMLHGKEDTTPEHVFGVVAPIAKAWQKPHERDLTHEAWRIVSYCWAQEEGEATQAQAKAVEQVDGLRAAFPDGPSDPQEFYDWLRGRVVLTHGQNHYVLQASGRYSTVPVKTSSL